MFERNKVDNIEHTGTPVELTTSDGEVLAGVLLIAMGRNLFDVLNSSGMFIEFQPYGGDRIYLAKTTLRNVKLSNVPKAQSLNGRLRDHDGFDPYQILGLPTGATFEAAKSAWHKLSMAYHPDRYASAELPTEVREYLSTMARRVNAAYSAIEATHQQSKRLAAGRATPVYTSGARA